MVGMSSRSKLILINDTHYNLGVINNTTWSVKDIASQCGFLSRRVSTVASP